MPFLPTTVDGSPYRTYSSYSASASTSNSNGNGASGSTWDQWSSAESYRASSSTTQTSLSTDTAGGRSTIAWTNFFNNTHSSYASSTWSGHTFAHTEAGSSTQGTAGTISTSSFTQSVTGSSTSVIATFSSFTSSTSIPWTISTTLVYIEGVQSTTSAGGNTYTVDQTCHTDTSTYPISYFGHQVLSTATFTSTTDTTSSTSYVSISSGTHSVTPGSYAYDTIVIDDGTFSTLAIFQSQTMTSGATYDLYSNSLSNSQTIAFSDQEGTVSFALTSSTHNQITSSATSTVTTTANSNSYDSSTIAGSAPTARQFVLGSGPVPTTTRDAVSNWSVSSVIFTTSTGTSSYVAKTSVDTVQGTTTTTHTSTYTSPRQTTYQDNRRDPFWTVYQNTIETITMRTVVETNTMQVQATTTCQVEIPAAFFSSPSTANPGAAGSVFSTYNKSINFLASSGGANSLVSFITRSSFVEYQIEEIAPRGEIQFTTAGEQVSIYHGFGVTWQRTDTQTFTSPPMGMFSVRGNGASSALAEYGGAGGVSAWLSQFTINNSCWFSSDTSSNGVITKSYPFGGSITSVNGPSALIAGSLTVTATSTTTCTNTTTTGTYSRTFTLNTAAGIAGTWSFFDEQDASDLTGHNTSGIFDNSSYWANDWQSNVICGGRGIRSAQATLYQISDKIVHQTIISAGIGSTDITSIRTGNVGITADTSVAIKENRFNIFSIITTPEFTNQGLGFLSLTYSKFYQNADPQIDNSVNYSAIHQ